MLCESYEIVPTRLQCSVDEHPVTVDEHQTIVNGHQTIVNAYKIIVDEHKIIVNVCKTTLNRHGTIADGQVVRWDEFHCTVSI